MSVRKTEQALASSTPSVTMTHDTMTISSKERQSVNVISWCEQTAMNAALPSVRLEDYVARSVLDKVFLGYYVFQIVTTLGMDMQGTFPAFLYPSWVRAFYTHHLEMWRDPWLANTWHHPWYFSICAWEYLVHVPFYFFAAHAYYSRITGTDRCSWIRTPVIMYCTQTMTAVSGVVFMALFDDFSNSDSEVLVPSGIFQRLKLGGMYGTFFVICLFNLWDALTGTHYQAAAAVEEQPQQRQHQQ